ncbi:MAG: hypothetical protein KBI47_12500 [Armatimonadetes bacterium]|jgi:hypothetical protein|nr:hypothetical protein [Armatimonadota bacterium]
MSSNQIASLQSRKASLLQRKANRTRDLISYRQLTGWEYQASVAERDIADLDRQVADIERQIANAMR